MSPFSQSEIDYLASQRLGRLATVDADGAPQNNPVGVHYNAELDTIDVYGRDLANSRKFHNVQSNLTSTCVLNVQHSCSLSDGPSNLGISVRLWVLSPPAHSDPSYRRSHFRFAVRQGGDGRAD